MKYALMSPVVTTHIPTATRRDALSSISRNGLRLFQRTCQSTARLLLATYQSTYSELTDSSSRIRRIVSASSSATDNCRIWRQLLACADRGIVSVTMSSSSADFEILSTAAPDNTG